MTYTLIGVTLAIASVLVQCLGFLAAHKTPATDTNLFLAGITWAAIAGSCTIAGMVGAGVPQLLKRMGADPATASSIFLTKATDIVSLAMFLGLAAVLLLP